MKPWIEQKKGLHRLSTTKKDKYKQNFEIIDKRWNCQLHQDLHAASHYLNLGLYYNNPNVEDDSEVIKGLMVCIHKLSLSEEEELKINTELPTYRGAQGLFGILMAKKMRPMLSPAEWWMQYGSSAPTLKKFAIKVLSLTCSSSRCERNWSVFEQLHSKKRNQLEWQKLNDLVYIKYNRALRRRYDMRDTIDPIILDDSTVQDPNDSLEGEEDAFVFEGDNLTWGVVAEAMGVDEEPYASRRTSRRKEGVESSSRSRGQQLIDEDEEENDVGPYKEVVEEEVDDEPVYEELDDL
ncbi:unnamed protein product [Lactuca saligna]|uniref:HAT C-terminal dimerisation domain-containing protein n=1 Tax=Lactuca saligna TaxID=75948 RepID=A0AA36DYL5_LACSI|nr:unnamed protein product [Lactuca saligna]